MTWRALLLAGGLALARPAQADEIWSCSYSYANRAWTNVFRVSGATVTQTSETGVIGDFQVLANNELGLVATFAAIENGGNGKKFEVAASTLVINKVTRKFWLSFAQPDVAPVENDPAYGSCVKVTP